MSNISSEQQQKRIFITGGSGYIGSVVTRLAVEAGYAVVGLSRSEAGDAKLLALGAESAVRGDLTSVDVIRRESERAGAGAPGSGVLHLADAWAGNWHLPYDRVVTIDGAAVDAMVEGLKQGSGGQQRTLVTTSGSLVAESDPAGGETTEEAPPSKDPANGRIKCEQHALSYDGKGVRVVTLRLAPFVYGRGGSGIGMCLRAAAGAGEAAWVGDGATRVTGVHVDDAARAYVLALSKAEAGAKGGAYNITHETHVTARELAGALAQVLGVPAASRTFDEVVASAGPGMLGKVLARFMSTEHRASNAKARRELGWDPREKGLLEEITEGSYVDVARALKSEGKPAGA
ncbi:hypothetical protein SLS62_000353 [Diatrype stigma]|uniref:NAD-dependent epimerase/dehydratase domain-containing protein n=1 Tax=Diatrype stigma TaxID=117547 RepID=A0AAN9YUD3_9PEZI